MGEIGRRVGAVLAGLLPARRGVGPLLQRDYWAVIRDCRLTPAEVVELAARRFPDFAPADLAAFRRVGRSGAPLDVGDEMEVRIRLAGTFRVRVVHRDRNSFTIATLVGHPEAGRITFGAYRNEFGDVIFHIRSRARSGSTAYYAGFLALGDALQTETWAEFLNRIAATAGSGVLAFIHAEKRELPPDAERPDATARPTFVAQGD
ncbi:MAG TPA: DUF1990 family protein [Longimicrobiales bacterium]